MGVGWVMEIEIPAFAGMTGGGCGNYGAGRGEMAPRLRGGFGWGAGVTGWGAREWTGWGLYEKAIELRDGRRALTLALSQGERG